MRELSKPVGGVLSYFTRHPTLANLLLVLMVMCGLVGIPNMRAQFFPDVILESVIVTTQWNGAGPQDVDSGIIQVLEPVLLGVEGVQSSSSVSREGSGEVRLEFIPNWDMARAADDVQTAVDAVHTLPQDAETPQVNRGAWRDRVADVVITGPVSVGQLSLYADELVARLFRKGVTLSTIQGVAAGQILIEVPSANLISHNIDLAQISSAIAQEVNADPAGDVTGANARVRTGTQKRSIEALGRIVLRSNPDGSRLLVQDVAHLTRKGADRERSYFVEGQSAVSVRVDRSNNGDAIGMQQLVQNTVDEMQPFLPKNVKIQLVRARAEAISDRLNLLVDNALIGLALVIVLLFLFLNARTAFWVAAGIPVAILAAVGFMYFGGLTINMVSLFGLIITLGIVVDDAIVVGEHADYRARVLGESPVVAAESAARRMAMPVFAATLTTLIAFFGLVAVGGRFGDMISDIPFTVIAVLLASLAECFFILPHHMSKALVSVEKDHWYDWPSRVVNKGFQWVQIHVFRPFMRMVIGGRYAVFACVIALLASQMALFIRGDVTWRFFNAPERGSVTGNFAMLEGATRADTIEMMRNMQQATDSLAQEYEAEHGINPVAFVMTQSGGNAGRGLSGVETKEKDLLGGISIELIDADLRKGYSSFDFVADLQSRVERHALLENLSFRSWRSGPGGDGLDVQFSGAQTDKLKAASEDLKRAVARFPEVSAVQDNMAYDKEELILDLTAQGQALGFGIDDLGRVLRNRLNGIEAARYPDGARTATVRVEIPNSELSADFLERMLIRTKDAQYVPLADLVSVQRRQGFSMIRRENGIQLVSVTGDISEDDPVRANEITQELIQEILPNIAQTRQVEWRMAGLSEQEDQFLNDARTGLILCLLGIYLVLVWIFGSWGRPFVVMAIIPFALVGTIYGHAAWNVPLSMFTVVGLLGMTGIIINDSIVLVSRIDELARDRDLNQAIIDGASDRLRPVLLTTLTTVLGMVPLLYEQSQQAQFLKPTVITLVYGLGFGMVLVLLIVPALIGMQQDFRRGFTALHRGVSGGRHHALIWPLRALLMAVLSWCAMTLGSTWVLGDMPIWLGELFPMLGVFTPKGAALLAFVCGTFVMIVFTYVLGVLRWKI